MKSELLRKMICDALRIGHKSRGRMNTRDVAFQFRMGAGFVGDVNRAHPFWTEPCLIDSSHPIAAYGLACLADAAAPNGVRSLINSTDSGITAIYGIAVRPFPLQQQATTNYGSISLGPGTQTPPTSGEIDILKNGYILVQLNGVASAYKGSPVTVYVATSTGSHVLGGFEATSAGGSNIALDATGTKIYFNGPADANGIVELVFNP
jgi:hypothetical protein